MATPVISVMLAVPDGTAAARCYPHVFVDDPDGFHRTCGGRRGRRQR